MKVLIIGSGGREHALAWKAAQSPRVTQVFVAPGNAGTALEPRRAQRRCRRRRHPGPARALRSREKIDLTIVGPEGPLVQRRHGRVRSGGPALFRAEPRGRAASKAPRPS